jgi:hypothetical protein
MKFSYKKTILKALICLFSLLSLDAHANVWYKSYFHSLKGSAYADNCLLIDSIQKIKYSLLMLYYRGFYNKANLDQVLIDIQSKLAVFQNTLLEEEKAIFISIKEKYNIDEIIWQKCLDDIEQFKKIHTNAMMHPCSNIVHDDNIPAEIMHYLKHLLQENGIHPDSASIMLANEDEIASHPSSYLAQAHQTIFIPHKDAQNNLVFNYEYQPARITIYPSLCRKTIIDQLSCCAHEIQHLISFHVIKEMVLIKYLEHYCSVAEKDFNESQEYKLLSQNHEAQAEILSAITSPHIARAMKQLRKK